MSKIVSVSLRLATPEDAHLPTYDNTKLQAANTCPTWGIVRYQMHKTFQNNSRAMALEAGQAMHELFAAARLYQLHFHQGCSEELFHHHGVRLFNKDRFDGMLEELRHEDDRDRFLNFSLQALYSSGFYDDPSDNRRTMTKLEEAGILYLDRWDHKRNPIWVRDMEDPKSDVGIEIAFDIVIEFTLEDDSGTQFTKEVRFTGKLDGLHIRDSVMTVGENKTAARIDEAWRMSFEMSSQVTGYCLSASVWSGLPVNKAIIWGLAIPTPKAYDNGLTLEYVNRYNHHFERWFEWFLHTVELYERYENDPIKAPKYTHSCNRYFRPCSLIPFCVADDEDQLATLEEEMVTEEWNPLHEGKANE